MASPLRVLHIIQSMAPESGGPAEVVRRLAQAAYEAGAYHTEIVCMDRPGEPWLQADPALPIHAVGPAMGKYGCTLRLDRWMDENLSRFDGVLVSGLWQYHGLAVWRRCRAKLPYLVYAHGMLDPWFKSAYPGKHFKKLLYWSLVERRILRDASAVLFTSSLEAQLAPTTFPLSRWNAFTVPYGTMKPEEDRVEQAREFYAKCPEVRHRPFVLFLGRLHRKKGCDLLVQAFARLARMDRETHLVVAGPDEQGSKRDLIAMAAAAGVANRVHFPGLLQGGAKWGAFYSAEAFVLPSHQENFGIAVAESLACGTPVLISNKVNVWREIVADGVGLVDEDDLEGVSRLLFRWRALSSADRMEMAAKCLGSFQSRFQIHHAPKVIASLLRQPIGLEQNSSRLKAEHLA